MRFPSGTALLLALSWTLSGCGGGGGAPALPADSPSPLPGATPAPGGVVSAEARQAVFRAVEEALSAPGQPRDSRNQALVALLRRQSAIVEADVAPEGTVWAQFADGRLYLINDTFAQGARPGGAAGARQVSAAAPAARAFAAPALSRTAAPVEIPRSAQAYLLTGIVEERDGLTFPLDNPPNPDLVPMLEKRGYQVTRQSATVETLKSLRNVAALHFSTHGGVGGNGIRVDRIYGLFTGTEATPETETQYAEDLRTGRLVYFTATIGYNGQLFPANATHYAITERFVRHYNWSFAPHSVAFLNGCYSDASGFCQVLRTLPSPCAVTAGWSNAAGVEKAWQAGRFLFDRLLGANLATPREAVPQRPFDIGAVYADMQKRGYTDASTAAYGESHLVVTDQPGSPATIALSRGYLLAPSIARMEVRERSFEAPLLGESRLVLYGLFGGEPGQVSVGGVPVPKIHSWSAEKIECQAADRPGPGFAGNVVVTAKNGARSNAVPLTQWKGVFTYTARPLSVHLPHLSRIDFDVTFRADIHPYRTEPGGAMKPQPEARFRAASGSTAHWEMQNGPRPGRQTLKKEALLPYGLHGVAFPEHGKFGTGYILEGTLTPQTGQFALAVAFLNCVGAERVLGVTPPRIEEIATTHDDLLLAQEAGVDPYGAPAFLPRVTGALHPTDFTLAAGNRTGRMTEAFDTRLQWPVLVPASAPVAARGEDQEEGNPR